jgi:serine/threonine protein kinase
MISRAPPDVFGITAGMAHMRAQQIIHADRKPKNVFLDDTSEPVIADFGLAKSCAGATVSRRAIAAVYCARNHQ